jgi:hypothetical protein
MEHVIAIYSTILALGNILMGHFEEKTPLWRRVLKFFVLMGIFIWVDAQFGRTAFYWALGLSCTVPVLIVHAWWLPKKKGINGWTAEPKEKYYALRGWKM